ncbi:MAG TPA: XRE family transcriptional regulator [Polyangiaceae bacterium]|nr:XRE family transcriptional regulator [Polyangiaceae bacterium]
MAAKKNASTSNVRDKSPPANEKSEPAASKLRPARPRVADVSGDDLGAAEMSRRVTEALKRYRRANNLSLDELAAKSGVSRAALSQIEGSRTNPTLSVLWKIAVGLEVPFQALLELEDDFGPKVLRAGGGSVFSSADGRFESRLLSPGGATPGLEVYELKLAAKALHKSDSHSRGTTETLVVLKGAIRIVVGDAEHDLSTGDTIFFRADVDHSYENRASHETRCINVIDYGRRS